MLHHHPHLTEHDGVLTIENVEATTLAEKYGTPLYVYSKKRILDNIARIKKAFETHGVAINLHYAIKANNNLAILKLLEEAGTGADASCANEIALAKQSGFPTAKIINSGNNNNDEDLKMALANVDKINLDDITILPRLLEFGMPKVLSFRLNPMVGSGSHGTNVFGGKTSKFGVDAETALRGYQMALEAGVKRFGIHMMPGTGGLDPEAYPNATKILIETMKTIAEKTGIRFEFMNIGGGFGIPYRDDADALDMEAIAEKIATLYKEGLARGKFGTPTLDCEPGRYIVGDAGLVLTRIHTVKKAHKQFAGTDAGMSVMMRPALHGSYHRVVCANKMNDEKSETPYTLCGPICENGDQYPEPYTLPKLEEGDLLAILDAGAYGYSMANNYNTQSRPAEVLVDGTNHHLIRKRETIEDITRNMVMPNS